MLLALTGATGFIGQHLLRQLPKHGYRLRMLLRRPASLPMRTASAVIGDLAQPQNGAKRFVFLSSIRAQCGPTADTVLTQAVEPGPTDAYGRSKLAAERGLAELDLDWVSLRAVLVYGLGVKGNMAQLMRLARSLFPLPLASLRARHSLLALENLSAAIEAMLAAPGTLRRVVIAADPQALTVAEMIAAMRSGLGRQPNVFPLPTADAGDLANRIIREMRIEEIAKLLSPLALFARKTVPAKDLSELIAWLKANPNKATAGIQIASIHLITAVLPPSTGRIAPWTKLARSVAGT